MFHLGAYYYEIKDYDNMKQYLLMAIDNHHADSMFNLGYYWSSTEYNANCAWVLDTNSYPWGTWGLSNTQSKTGGGYAIPICKKSLTE